MLATWHSNNKNEHGDVDWARLDSICLDARAALAKAKGE